MMFQLCEIGSEVMKTAEKVTLWKADRGVVEVEKDSLAVPVKLGDDVKGYAFHGKGKLALDTIVETGNGAVGETTEKDLVGPFLMFGQTEQVQQHLVSVSEEDLRSRNYKDSQGFIEYIEDVFHRFLRKRMHGCYRDGTRGFVFAFANPEGRPDLLVANHERIVYKSRSFMYVSSGRGVIIRRPGHGLIMKHGNCCGLRGCH